MDAFAEIRARAMADAMIAYMRLCGGEAVLKADDMGISRSEFMRAVAIIKREGRAIRTAENRWRVRE